MANIAIFRINYKSDFILTLDSDAGWMTPFCIKFWTGAPSQAYFAGFDGETYTHCAPVEDEPTKLVVQFDDHNLPVGELKFQIGYHFTVADFPTSVEDEVLNQAAVIIDNEGTPEQVMLDFTGETAPEIEFSLPAYANEAQRIENEQERIAAEQQRIANEETRLEQETARVNEFATLKSQSQAATSAANTAASLANEKAQLAADKAALADAAANLATQKAQLAADKAALAQQKADYAQAQGDYAKAQGDTALADHERAVEDHTQAGQDHTTAANDHITAGNDHTRAEADHTRAESDHAAVEVYVDSLGAFDISAYHATGGVLAKYADLTAALGTNGANIPEVLRKGGMSVKFVQGTAQSSDNKYVQYRCMANAFTTDVAQWQGVDDEPTTGSDNLVKSYGVVQYFFDLMNKYRRNNSADIDISPKDYEEINANLSLQNTWGKQGTTTLIPIPSNATSFTIISSSGGVYAYLKSISTLNPENGSSIAWNGTAGRISYNAGTTNVGLRAGTRFIAISRKNSAGDDISPSSIVIHTKGEEMPLSIYDPANIDSIVEPGIYTIIPSDSQGTPLLIVRVAGNKIIQVRISANYTGDRVLIQKRTLQNSTWSNWEDGITTETITETETLSIQSKALFGKVFDGYYKNPSNEDSLTTSGRYLSVISNSMLVPRILCVYANGQNIYQFRFVFSNTPTIMTRSSSDGGTNWSTWVDFVKGFTGTFSTSAGIDTLTDSGIYRANSYIGGYGFPLIQVRREESTNTITQVRYNIGISGGYTISKRSKTTASGSTWSDWETILDSNVPKETALLTSNDYRTVSDYNNELLACGAMMQAYSHKNSKNKDIKGNVVMVYQADETNDAENEYLGTAITKLSFFNMMKPEDKTVIEVAKAGDVKDGYAIGSYSPYDCNMMLLSDTAGLCWFRINGLLNSNCKMSVCDIDLANKTVSNFRDMTLDGAIFNEAAMIAAYSRLTGVTLETNQLYPAMTGNVVEYDGKFYTYLGGTSGGAAGVTKAFGGILLSSTNGVDWVSEMAQDISSLSGTDHEIGEGTIAIDEENGYLYICGRNFYSPSAHCIQSVYDLSDWSVITPPQIISDGGVSSKPMCTWLNDELYLWVQGAQNTSYPARRNTANIYKVTLPSCSLTKVKTMTCPEGCASPTLLTFGNSIYAAFQTDERGIRLADQARSNIAFMRIY